MKRIAAPGPLVLDLDGSVAPLAGETRLALGQWQAALRFGCGNATFARFCRALDAALPARHGTVLLGSGDFHHLSLPLIERCIARGGFNAGRPLRVVVLDNHPDNMRFPWGVHCGSWVRRVALHPAVAHVHVAGITSGDIGTAHAWENYLAPLRAGKLSYWSCGVDTRWARWADVQGAFHGFARVADLAAALAATLRAAPGPSYLSIDKDVFAPGVVRTNWDQGAMAEADALAIVEALAGHIAGSDITGDVSAWRHPVWWKRWMSAGDGQAAAAPDAQTLAAWRPAQAALDARLTEAIALAAIPDPP